MKRIHSQDTIAALATPAGEGGIAIVRISGSKAPEILGKIFRKSGGSAWDSHHLYYGKFIGPQGELIDQGLAVWMKAPRSYTGEEVVELHLHGGRLIARRILEAAYREGARPAEAGEFSERAFLNGKMDLTQAEAVADMIAAQSEESLNLAQAQWQGALSGPVSRLRQKLLELLVNLEAAIDFPDEEIEIIDRKAVEGLLQDSHKQLVQWLGNYETGRILREGLNVVLLGRPNVGKSSLLNALAQEEAAIVHPQPGTTRDAIERTIQLEGLAVRLVDTAGFRETEGEVEQAGIQRSRQWLERADLVLVLFDTSLPLSAEDGEIAKIASKKRSLWVLNKIDLPLAWKAEELSKFCLDEKTETTGNPQQTAIIKISVKTGEGISSLEKRIPEIFCPKELRKGDHVFLNQLRHKKALEKAREALESAAEGLRKNFSPEFLAQDTMAATHALGEIIGEVGAEDILENIFNRFCIGK